MKKLLLSTILLGSAFLQAMDKPAYFQFFGKEEHAATAREICQKAMPEWDIPECLQDDGELEKNQVCKVIRDSNTDKILGFMLVRIDTLLLSDFFADFIKSPAGASSNAQDPLALHEQVLNLDWICIDPQVQRGGYGKKLLDHALTIAKAHECFMIACSPLTHAIPFYEKNGYRKISLNTEPNETLFAKLLDKPTAQASTLYVKNLLNAVELAKNHIHNNNIDNDNDQERPAKRIKRDQPANTPIVWGGCTI